jgi:outer membrane protein OmpA-like peptidoglycan-associated protein
MKNEYPNRAVKKAELNKILIETQKILSEKAKIDLERISLEEQLNKKFWMKRDFWKIVGGCLLIAPAIWFYIIEVIIPISKVENYKLMTSLNEKNAEIKTSQDSLKLARIKHQEEVKNLRTRIEQSDGTLIAEKKQLFTIINELLDQSRPINSDERVKLKQLLITLGWEEPPDVGPQLAIADSGTTQNILVNMYPSFMLGKATLEQSDYPTLDQIVKILETYPNSIIEICGHTDNIGDDQYNLKLSRERAQSVANYLINKGIPSSSIRVFGYGSSRPIASNDTPEGRFKNRRIEFLLRTEWN